MNAIRTLAWVERRAYPAAQMGRLAGSVMRSVLPLLCAALFACGQDASVNFRTGELLVAVRAGDFMVPDSLRDDQSIGAVVQSISCAMCSDITLPTSCVGGFCDPDPIPVSVPLGSTIDFESLRGDFELPIGRIDEIRLRGGSWQVLSNTLTVDLRGAELWWSPEGTASGLTLLGRFGDVPAGSAPSGEITLDSAGETSLAAYLADTSSRAQFFVSVTVDVDPGQPFPEGDLDLSVVLDLTATGPLL